MIRILGTAVANSPEWHSMRAGRIGGSSIAVVCGWSPFQTRADLLEQMAAGTSTERTSKAIERGHALEDAVAEWLARDKGLTYDAEASAATYMHDELDWAIFNPDRLTIDDGPVVEVKTTHDRREDAGWGRAGTDRIPLYYAAQVQWGCGITGRAEWILTVLHGATNGRPDLARADYRGQFDPDAYRFLLGKAERFINELHAKERAAA